MQWAEQLIESRKGKLHFGDDTSHSDHLHVRSGPDRILEQCGLADAGLPPKDEHAAGALAGSGEQFVDGFAFLRAAKESLLNRASAHGSGGSKVRIVSFTPFHMPFS